MRDELARPWETYERHVRIRVSGTQRTQRGDRAEHIAQEQGANDGDAHQQAYEWTTVGTREARRFRLRRNYSMREVEKRKVRARSTHFTMTSA
jgi:hypothetical protein